MLRKTTLLCIHKALINEPYMYAEDFEILHRIGNNGDQTFVTITYRGDTEMCLTATIPHETNHNDEFQIVTRFQPGAITGSETTVVEGLSGLISQITSWTKRLTEDLLAEPELRAVDAIAERVRQVEERLSDIPDSFATPAQVEQLHSMLNELENRLRVQIDALQISVEEKESKLKELQQQFDALHKKAQGTTVKQMLLTIVSRVYRVAADPDLPKLIENGKQIAGILGHIDGQQNS